MADPVGIAVGAISLATAVSGIFVKVVECFEYVELGRRFGKDFGKSQARLAVLKLQITRWGVSSGNLPDPQTGRPRTVNVDAETAAACRRLLDLILGDTEDLQKKLQRYHQPASADGGADLEVSGPSEMDPQTRALNARTNAIIAKRLRGVPILRKTKWALYDKKLFDRLLEDIAGNLAQLEKVTPQVAESQRELCGAEVKEIQGDADDQQQAILELLHDASRSNQDTLLEDAVQAAIASRGAGHLYERTEVGENVKLDQGDLISQGFQGQAPTGRVGHRYGKTIGRGRATIRQGDTYGSVTFSHE